MGGYLQVGLIEAAKLMLLEDNLAGLMTLWYKGTAGSSDLLDRNL
jgi:hypothetical protein